MQQPNPTYVTRSIGPFVYSWNADSTKVYRQQPPLRSTSIVGICETAEEAEDLMARDARRQVM